MSTIAPEKTSVSVTAGRSEITMETGHLAKQADGAVVLRSGDTMILATATGRLEAREGADFFPLTVDVEERMYAAGKIPGGFFKREGRPTEKAILTARMIDRPIRPLWPKGFRNEVQVICTTLSADLVTPYDILCINGASAALMISPLPFQGPVGAVRIGLIDGELVVNPTLPEVEDSDLDLIVVGTKEGLTMVEAGAAEVPEEKLLEAFDIAHAEIRKLCEAQEDLRRQVGKPKWLDLELTEELDSAHGDRIASGISSDGLREALRPSSRSSKSSARRSRSTPPRRTSFARRRFARASTRSSSGAASRPSSARCASSSRMSSALSRRPSRTPSSSSRPSAPCSTTTSSSRSTCRSRSARRRSRARPRP